MKLTFQDEVNYFAEKLAAIFLAAKMGVIPPPDFSVIEWKQFRLQWPELQFLLQGIITDGTDRARTNFALTMSSHLEALKLGREVMLTVIPLEGNRILFRFSIEPEKDYVFQVEKISITAA